MTTKELAMEVFYNDNGGYDKQFCRSFLIDMKQTERKKWANEQLIAYYGNEFSDRFYAMAATQFLKYFGF